MKCRLTTALCSHTGPHRETPFHPGEPYSQTRWGPSAALSVRGLHAHAPAAVRHLPAPRQFATQPSAKGCRRVSVNCAWGWGRASEAAQGAGKHVHPPGCGPGCGSQHQLYRAADGNPRWAAPGQLQSEHIRVWKAAYDMSHFKIWESGVLLRLKNGCYSKCMQGTQPLPPCEEQDTVEHTPLSLQSITQFPFDSQHILFGYKCF